MTIQLKMLMQNLQWLLWRVKKIFMPAWRNFLYEKVM